MRQVTKELRLWRIKIKKPFYTLSAYWNQRPFCFVLFVNVERISRLGGGCQPQQCTLCRTTECAVMWDDRRHWSIWIIWILNTEYLQLTVDGEIVHTPDQPHLPVQPAADQIEWSCNIRSSRHLVMSRASERCIKHQTGPPFSWTSASPLSII